MAKHESAGEREILRTIRAMVGRRSTRAVRVGIGDDCAVITPRAGEELVVTTDFSIEDRHFRRSWHPPEAIGHKCLARGLSDIAAMGARPVAAFLSLAVPRELTAGQSSRILPQVSPRRRGAQLETWISGFYRGLLALAEREGVTLAGGDLAESSSLAVADIVVVGGVPKGRALLRSTARAGDVLYVTGTLGGAAAELSNLEANAPLPRTMGAHFYPQPRVAAGQALMRRRLATACIDISDGLSTELLHLCEGSDLSAELDAAALPVDASATLQQALHGGDDYELLFAASPKTRVPRQLGGVAVHAIGHMVPRKRGARITLITEEGSKAKRTPLDSRGWQHF